MEMVIGTDIGHSLCRGRKGISPTRITSQDIYEFHAVILRFSIDLWFQNKWRCFYNIFLLSWCSFLWTKHVTPIHLIYPFQPFPRSIYQSTISIISCSFLSPSSFASASSSSVLWSSLPSSAFRRSSSLQSFFSSSSSPSCFCHKLSSK